MIVATTAKWTPLEEKLKSLGDYYADVIREFMWMYGDEDNRIEYYKHSATRRYLLLDQDGRCFQQKEGLIEVDFQGELQRVCDLGKGDK